MLALSQLSYGPLGGKCSGELEVSGPVDPQVLVVSRGPEPKLNCCSVDRHLGRQEVAGVELEAVSRDCIDLAWKIGPMDQPLTAATAPATPDDDDISSSAGHLHCTRRS